MKTINIKFLGETHNVKLFKKFQVSNFNLAVVDFHIEMEATKQL